MFGGSLVPAELHNPRSSLSGAMPITVLKPLTSLISLSFEKTSVVSLLGSPSCSVQLQEKQFAIFNHIILSLKLVIIVIILPQIKPQRLQFV